jgi:hypothetical protein
MSDQVVPEFGERVRSALVAGERLAERLKRQEGTTMNVLSSPEYQELVRLKVVIELETSRALSETARVAAAIEGRDLTDMDVQTEVDQ